jgi:hypothetical protein
MYIVISLPHTTSIMKKMKKQYRIPVPSLLALCAINVSEKQLRQLAKDSPAVFGAVRMSLLDTRTNGGQALKAYQTQHEHRLKSVFGLNSNDFFFN